MTDISVPQAILDGANSDHVSVELSARRTGMSFQRTRMSADRTLMSAIRTSLALISFGFTIFQFFQKLKAAGNFSPVSATGATIKAGTTPVVFNWDYLNLPSYVGVSNWKVFVPPHAILGGYYAQAINKEAPHPAAARLWEEFLYSQAPIGGQNLWLKGGARPVQQAAMTANGSINTAAAALLPTVSGSPTFLSPAQSTDAANYLAANWAKAVG